MNRDTATTITDERLDDLYERLATAAHIADTLLTATRRHGDIVMALRALCVGDITPEDAIAQSAG
ncbi:hypothetical protein ACH427_14170 [Streptomyces sp. NPDC020379]|uniref:Uncharacterized protein n=1 Tax=Streptomyces hesseae TaxID=3075519 RepID=A0ABU2SSN3_9ACTN|nr:hypothetical protein [Streptomyces sp. DSM 40473]MDT0451855.1 hypothetical protein [Streptomyces sp. DSM 40473]